MIYVTGDTHSDFRRFTTSAFPEQKEMTKDDYVIICGDFGGVWYQENSDEIKQENYWLDWLEDKPFTTLFVDGNHECINKYSDVLTENGWENIQDVYNRDEDTKLASVDLKTHKLCFDYPQQKIKKFSDEIIDIDGVNFKQSVTPNHEIVLNGSKIKAKDILGKTIQESELRFHIDYSCDGIKIDKRIIEIMMTIIADATIVDYSKYSPNSKKVRIQYHLKKKRKIVYIQNILDDLNIPYTYRENRNKEVYICIYGEWARKLFSLLERKGELHQKMM